MADYIDVAVAAIQVVKKKHLDAEDRHVSAVYSVMVQKGLSDSSMASAALDVFHSECAVSVLDDFEFYVFDPRTGLVLSEDADHESYSKTHLGRDCEHIADKLPKIYSVTVEAIGGDKTVIQLGTVIVATDKKRDANLKALNALWDSRLDSASSSARYQNERLR